MYIELCASENRAPSNAEFASFKVEMETFAVHWVSNEHNILGENDVKH